jgi:hypothetical protein
MGESKSAVTYFEKALESSNDSRFLQAQALSCLSLALHTLAHQSGVLDANGLIESSCDCLLRACVLDPNNVSLLLRYASLDSSADAFRKRAEQIRENNTAYSPRTVL